MLHVALRKRGHRKLGPGQAGVVLVVIGLVLLVAGAWLGHEAEAILGNLGTAQGKVLALEPRKGEGRPRATVQFDDAEGSTVFLLHQRVGKAAREGDPVTVIYDRRDSGRRTSLKRPQDLRPPYLVLLGAGGILTSVAAALLVVGVRNRLGATPQP